MLLQVLVELERVAAQVARERAVVGVDGLVPLERMVVDERLVARVAHEVLLVPVPFQMVGKLGPRAEALLAVRALVAADAEVHQPVMDAERGALREAFTARRAHERLLAGVRAPVVVHVALLRETPAAHVARVLLDAVVHGRYVSPESEHGAKLFVAHIAHVRFLARVRAVMVQEPALDGRTIVRALIAFVVHGVAGWHSEPLAERAALTQPVRLVTAVRLSMSGQFRAAVVRLVTRPAPIAQPTAVHSCVFDGYMPTNGRLGVKDAVARVAYVTAVGSMPSHVLVELGPPVHPEISANIALVPTTASALVWRDRQPTANVTLRIGHFQKRRTARVTSIQIL